MEQNVEHQETPGPSRQSTVSKKKRKREKAAVYRQNKILHKKLENASNRAHMYRMRWERARQRLKRTRNQNEETPRSKTRRLLRQAASNFGTVRKTLNFHHVLVGQMKQSARESDKIKKSVKQILCGKIMKKYRVSCYGHNLIHVSNKGNKRRKTKPTISALLRDKIQAFFERDDNSRITTDRKKTKTKNKKKKQIRLF